MNMIPLSQGNVSAAAVKSSISIRSLSGQWPRLLAIGLILTGLIIAITQPWGLSAVESRTLAVVIGSIGLWATGAVAESLTSVIFFAAAMLANVAPVQVVFSGLMSSPTWLVFTGVIIGAALKRNGLGDWVAVRLAERMAGTYRREMVGMVLFGLITAFFVPSAMGRTVLILPILVALAQQLGYREGSRGFFGIVLAGVMGSYLPSYGILTANVPNMVLAGVVEKTFGISFRYADYLLLHFPVLGFLKAVVLTAVLFVMFGGKHEKVSTQATQAHRPMSAKEKRLAVVLCLALAVWATDSFHQINPAWVGLVVAVLCLWPTFGLMPPKALQNINLEPMIYVGGIISLGTLITHSGLAPRLANWALNFIPLAPDHSVQDFAVLSGMSAILGLFTTQPGMPVVMAPLAGDFATASGLPVSAVLITLVVGLSTVILPYQAPPLVVAMQVTNAPRRDLTLLTVVPATLGVLLLWPLDYLWVTLLGRF